MNGHHLLDDVWLTDFIHTERHRIECDYDTAIISNRTNVNTSFLQRIEKTNEFQIHTTYQTLPFYLYLVYQANFNLIEI